MTKQYAQPIADWFAEARADLEAGRLTLESLDGLRDKIIASAGRGVKRQRLLYLHAASPNIRSGVIAAALHEPVPDTITQIDPLAEDLPYQSVMDALLEGWRIVHFPDQRSPYDDREIDMVGYEFILEKIEVYDAE